MHLQVTEALQALADRLGVDWAGPREVTDRHTVAWRNNTALVPHARAQAYVEEGRMMVRQLMGYLAFCYRADAPMERQSERCNESSH